MVNLYASALTNYQLGSHSVVVSCLNIIIRIEIWMIATLDPHMESSVVAPTSSHQVSCSQVLFGLSLVEIEHKEE